MDEMDEVVICKYCKSTCTYGQMIWLSGKEMCPQCYMHERRILDNKLKREQNSGGESE